jgi:hypothetical protein
VVVAFAARVALAQLPACDCSNSAQCVNMHGGDTHWQCIIGPGTICAQNGSLTGLCTYKSCTPNPHAICPDIFSPVVCSNGVTYSNACYATAACATGCVPLQE